MKLWRPALAAAALMLMLFVRVLTWHLHQAGSDDHLTPHGQRLFTIFCIATPLLPGLAILWAAVTARVVTRLIVTLALLIVLGLVVPVMFLGVLPPIFGGQFTKSATSPDGAREAHVLVHGLLGCTATLYESERRGVWGTRGESRSVKCDSEGVSWADDGRPVLEGAAPESLPFFLGPH